MDPITQICVGAAVAAAVSPKEEVRLAAFLGAVAGAAPDLDVLIRSDADPLFGLLYHRHFSHALIMAPVIGICIAAVFRLLMFASKMPFRKFVLYATAGAITHGPIDACTSYGTLLYWPFSNHRESWDLISIIDPLFTVPLVLLTLLAFKWRMPFFAKGAVVFCLAYLGLCGFQHFKATEAMENLAARRNHKPDVYSVRPSLANNVLWRTVYRHKGRYYVDAVQTIPGRKPRVYTGRSVAEFSVEDATHLAAPGSALSHDIERFRYFSQGYLYRHPSEPNMLCDLRYALFPDSVLPLWGIRIDPEKPESHVELKYYREFSKSSFIRLWQMVQGQKVEPINYP
jgi:inner membrane protein